jgi:endo-1,4-beta-mannosidase
MSNLKKSGVNVVTVFVESLDLDASPIIFEYKKEAILRFMEKLVAEAEKNGVYVLFRLYDTFYYKDDGYGKDALNPKNRKWTDTSWFKQKPSPDGFFDEDLDNAHKDRIKTLLERFRDRPNVLGWDLVNEIDNKVRFNEASLEKRRSWLERMAAFAKSIDRNHLVFYSFLTWDPKDGPS